MARKVKDPRELDDERLVRTAEDDFDVKFKWYLDTEEDPGGEGEDAYDGEYYYCVATSPDGRSESLAGIEDPSPAYKKTVEADLARALGIEPEPLPPEIETMHTISNWDEAIIAKEPIVESPEDEEVFLRKINDVLTPLGFTNWKNAWFKDIEVPVKGRSYPGRVRFGFEIYRNQNELTVELNGFNKRGRLSFDLEKKIVWLHDVPFEINRIDDFAYFSKLALKASGTASTDDLNKLLVSLARYYKAAYKEVASLYEVSMGKILTILNPAPDIETMHEISGWDEALIRRFEEAGTEESGPLLKVTPEAYEKAIKWAKENESLGYRLAQSDWGHWTLVFPNPKYPGQKGFQFELIHFYDPVYAGRNNQLKYSITYGVKRIYLDGFLVEDDTLEKIFSRQLAIGTDLNPQKYRAITTAPESGKIEGIVNRFIQELENAPEVETMHTISGWDEGRLTENLLPVTLEDWAGLKPGDIVISKYRGSETGRFKIISQHTLGSKALPIILYFASSLAGDWKGRLNYEKGKWYSEKTPDVETMHTISGWDEGRLIEARLVEETTPVPKAIWTKLCSDLENRYPDYCETTFHDPRIRMTSRATGSVLEVEAYPEKRDYPTSPLRVYKISFERLPSLPRRVYVYHYSMILGTSVTDMPLSLPDFINNAIDGMDVKGSAKRKKIAFADLKASPEIVSVYEEIARTINKAGVADIETMHTISGWDEALIRRVTKALVDENPANY
jgi:hypothetical protein